MNALFVIQDQSQLTAVPDKWGCVEVTHGIVATIWNFLLFTPLQVEACDSGLVPFLIGIFKDIISL